MSETWKQWEGRTADGFALQEYLGCSEHSAVFLTAISGGGSESEKAAIKLISAGPDAERQVERWKTTQALDYPNLIRIYTAGRCEVDGTELLYVVMEYAEENLSQILPERPLTGEETRGMLPPVLRALQYAHGKGLVHGHIRPSNILAIRDQVKLSSDSLSRRGEFQSAAKSAYDPPEVATAGRSTAGDVWQLGMTLVEVLTQRLTVGDGERPSASSAALPQPFGKIVENCLQIDPASRWTVKQIADRLDLDKSAAAAAIIARPSTPEGATGSVISGGGRPAENGKKTAKWPYGVAFAAVALIVIFLIARAKEPASLPVEQTSQNQSATSAGGVTSTTASSGAEPNQAAADGSVVTRAMPEISSGALHSVRGRIRIQVKINVDKTGNVADAHLKSPGPSRYFAARTLDATREWKFKPPVENGQPVASQWMAQFIISRNGIDDSVTRVRP